MVKEREPPRAVSPSKTTQPVAKVPSISSGLDSQGGTREPLQSSSSLGNKAQSYIDFTQEAPSAGVKHANHKSPGQRQTSNPFNVPKAGAIRPEHHRPAVVPPQQPRSVPAPNPHAGFNSIANGRTVAVAPSASNGSSFYDLMSDYASIPARDGFRPPTYLAAPSSGLIVNQTARPVDIARPANMAPQTIAAAPRPMYSSNAGFQPVNAWKAPSNFVDLTSSNQPQGAYQRDPKDRFDPNQALRGESAFGSFDPSSYVDSAQASENIKALLEGAFEEDDEDKQKTQLRRRVKKEAAAESAADILSAKLKGLEVKDKQEDQRHEEPEDEEDDGSVEGLSVKLLPHQIDGVAWMLDKEIGERKKNGVLPKGGILADDMGLGKTIQALSLILTNPRPTNDWIEENPKKKFPRSTGKGTLVVAPLALIKQWEAEIKDKVDQDHKLKVLVHHGPSRTKPFDDLKKYDVVISTYQTLTSEFAGTSPDEHGIKVGCFGVHWYRVILDEAHSIKNRNAKMTQAAYHLRAVYRWCLTGTPMQNNLEELQSLIRFLQIKPYCELKVWKEQIGTPMKNGRGGLAMKRLQFFLKAFMKRRTKEILKKEGALKFGKASTKKEGVEAAEGEDEDEGPGFKIVGRKIEEVIVGFSDSERAFYDKLAARTEKSLAEMNREGNNDYIGALVLLLRLRQVCNHPDLIKINLSKEKDALGGDTSNRAKSSKNTEKALGSIDGLDDISNMFGALSMETKSCDVCKAKLGKDDAGAIRCKDCEADISELEEKNKGGKRKPKAGFKPSRKVTTEKKQRRVKARRVTDSDDEDAEDKGEWLVGTDQRDVPSLGRAGGQEDEDAEGGGEWLVSDEDESRADDSFASTASETTARTTMSPSSASEDEEEGDSSDDSQDPSTDILERKPTKLASTKIKHLMDILAREAPTHKIIVFSEFTSMLDLIEPLLDKASPALPGYTRYDGRMAHPAREASLHALRTDPSVRILLCSLKCGSLGLNLTCASRVVLLEPFWNPFVEEQAIDRVHRLNQTQDVVVYKLMVKDSVEEKILALQTKKRELATQAIEGGAAGKGGVNKLSMKDILGLFKRDAEVGHERDGISDRRERVLPLAGPSTAPRVVSARHSGGPGQFGNAYGRRW